MRLNKLILPLLLIGVVHFVGTAYGQVPVPCPSPISSYSRPNFYLRIGGAFLVGPVPNPIQPTGGIGYETKLRSTNAGGAVLFGVSLDYIPVPTSKNGQALVTTMPELLYLKRVGPGNTPSWWTIGIGARWSSQDMPEMNLHVDQNPAWELEYGKDFSRNSFGSIRFIGGWRPWDDGLFTTELGFRF